MNAQPVCTCPKDSQTTLLEKVVNNLYLLASWWLGGTPMTAVGIHGNASAEFARPGDTAAYAAKDVVSNSTVGTTLMRFQNIARALGKGGYITKARVITDNKTFLPRLRLWLYTVNNPSVQPDNAPFRLLWANRATRIGYIDFDALATEDGTNSDSASSLRADVRLAFTCDPASRDLYGVIETLDAATPASAQNFRVDLESEQN